MSELRTVGWREWVLLPELENTMVKAKLDTGAKTSSIDAHEIETFDREGQIWVRFEFYPHRLSRTPVATEAPVVDVRTVTSSNGHQQTRIAIATTIEIDGESLPVELTLANRERMKFALLIGRHALRGRFAVDAGLSYETAESVAIRGGVKR